MGRTCYWQNRVRIPVLLDEGAGRSQPEVRRVPLALMHVHVLLSFSLITDDVTAAARVIADSTMIDVEIISNSGNPSSPSTRITIPASSSYAGELFSSLFPNPSGRSATLSEQL